MHHNLSSLHDDVDCGDNDVGDHDDEDDDGGGDDDDGDDG